jgi:hypothetical protein
MGTEPALRFVTGSLKLVYKQSTPIGVPLEIRVLPASVLSWNSGPR